MPGETRMTAETNSFSDKTDEDPDSCQVGPAQFRMSAHGMSIIAGRGVRSQEGGDGAESPLCPCNARSPKISLDTRS